MVGSALAEGPRVGRRETVHTRKRTLRSGQERRPTAEGNRDTTPPTRALTVEASCDAAQFTIARPTANPDWSRQERSRQCVRFRQDSVANKRSTRHTRLFPLSARQGSFERSGAARRLLSDAFQSHDGGSGCSVESIRATDADRISVSSLKSDLGIRPIYHQKEDRIDAHIFVAFLAYCLQVTLKNRLMAYAPGLTPTAVLEKLGTIQMIDVCIPTCDGRWLILPRYTQPDPDLKLMLHHLRLELPSQPPPRITATALPAVSSAAR